MIILTRQPIHVDPLCAESNTHVAVAALGHDAHFEVIETTGRRDGLRGAHARCILVGLAMAWKHNKHIITNDS